MALTPNAALGDDRRIADLRSALGLAIQYLSFSAGREKATDPEYSAQLLAVANDLEAVLLRTAPADPGSR